MNDSYSKQQMLSCLKVEVARPWSAYFVPVESLPLKQNLRPLLLNAMTELIHSIRDSKALQRKVWLLLDELHHDNAVREISRNAAIWQPSMGLGLRPENPPPRYWTSDDFLEKDYDTPDPPLKHTVALLDADEVGSDLACNLMTGIGGLFHTLHSAPIEQVCGEWYQVFQPTILEEGLAAYPLYAPIFGLKSLLGQQSQTISRWMGSVEVYLRESAEDKGIFVLSREPLDEMIEHSKYLSSSGQEGTQWSHVTA